MEINAKMVKELREKTGAGMMDCKKALKESSGDLKKAVIHLREKGLAKAAKREGKATKEGVVWSYVHGNGKIGVLVEINCETDFVAKTDDFRDLAKNLAMQIAASNPMYIKEEDVPENFIAQEKEILKKQAAESGKPEKVIENIVQGRLQKSLAEICLLGQPYIRETDKAVKDYMNEVVSKLGEKIVVKRFVRFALGEKE